MQPIFIYVMILFAISQLSPADRKSVSSLLEWSAVFVTVLVAAGHAIALGPMVYNWIASITWDDIICLFAFTAILSGGVYGMIAFYRHTAQEEAKRMADLEAGIIDTSLIGRLRAWSERSD